MMLLDSNDGIRCDKCAQEFRHQFVYNSIDCYQQDKLIESFDYCEDCFSSLYSYINDNAKCEVCGQEDGVYVIKVDEVDVDVHKYTDGGRKVIKNILSFKICQLCYDKLIGGVDEKSV